MQIDFEQVRREIKPLDREAMQRARLYQDDLLKPIGSLGRLEELAVQLSGISGALFYPVEKKAIAIFCADNGVYAEGVSACPQEVTKTQAVNFLRGITGVAVLARQGGIDLRVIDIGIREDVQANGLMIKKVAKGTKNAALGPAMSKEEMQRAMEVGFSMAGTLKEEGYQAIGTGEMGIANTTTATAVICALCGCQAEDATGKGAGIHPEQLKQKQSVIKKMLAVNQVDASDPVSVVQKVGGLDLAGLFGLYLGAAFYRIPIVIDGVISIAAALAAYTYCPACLDFMLPSHRSEERGYQIAAEKMGLRPYFQLGLRLGEGSGCPFTFYLMEAASRLMMEMGTFSDGKVDKTKYVDIREDGL